MVITDTVKTDLHQIGSLLDRGIFPRIQNGGFFTLSNPSRSPLEMSEEPINGRGTQRSESGSRKRPPSRQRSSDRATWTGIQRPPIEYENLRAQYASEVAAVTDAYPDAQVWEQKAGFWIRSESSLLPGLGRKATFLTGIKLTPIPSYVAWGFWNGKTWIGPRHTNFPEGSICAFEQRDGTWVIGDPLIELLDLYSLWALRHLHLELFHRWPGRQAAFESYERLLELQPDELCGCGMSDLHYRDCCFTKDRNSDIVKAAISFNVRYHGGKRSPPVEIVQFMSGSSQLPDIETFFKKLANPWKH